MLQRSPRHAPDETLVVMSDDSSGTPATGRPVLAAFRAIVQFLVVFAILAGATLLMQRLVASAPERPSRPAVTIVVPVAGERVMLADNRPTIRGFGEVVAARSVDLRPALTADILEVHPALAAGGEVREGELLVRFDAFEAEGLVTEARANRAQTEAAIAENRARVESEEAQLTGAREQLQLAEADLERARELRQSGSLTDKQIEDRQLVVSQRDAALRQRESNLAIEAARLQQNQAQRDRLAWKLQQAERALGDVEMRAPFTGIIRSANAEVGKRAGPSDVLVSLYSDRLLDVRFTLSNAQFGRLVSDSLPLIGRNVDVTWNVGGRDYVFPAVVTRIGAEIESARGGVEVFAKIDTSAHDIAIRPGAFVSVALPDMAYPDSAAVPETSVHSGDVIHVIADDGSLEARNVEIAAYDSGRAIVLSGLGEGEVVMATRLTEVDPGTRVRAVTGSAEGHGAPNEPSGPARTRDGEQPTRPAAQGS